VDQAGQEDLERGSGSDGVAGLGQAGEGFDPGGGEGLVWLDRWVVAAGAGAGPARGQELVA
jgi:hypothetical protein